MIQHKFRLVIKGLNLRKSVSFKNISEKYRNTILSQTKDGNLEIIISKTKSRPIKVSKSEAQIEANELVDRLSIIDNHYISELKYLGYYNNENEFIREKTNITVKASLQSIITDPVSYYSKPENVKIFNSSGNIGVLRTFRTTYSIEDPISRYLIYYGLLLILVGEKQKKVDEFIKRHIPDILVVDGKSGHETIITSIRNQIAHPKDLDMDRLLEQVKLYIDSLYAIIIKVLREGNS